MFYKNRTNLNLSFIGIILLFLALLVLLLFSQPYLHSYATETYSDIDRISSINKSEIPKSNLPYSYNLNWLIQNGKYISSIYKRLGSISFGPSSEYSKVEGVVCYRGNNYRNSASYGVANIPEKKLEKIWSYNIGHIDSWTGVGWNGQPAIVKWDKNLKMNMNIFEQSKKKNDLKEVIYGTLDSKVYFLDLETGKPTRKPIQTFGPIKGSVSVDPRGVPLLYVGQGIDRINNKSIPIGYSIYSLLDQKRLFFINGMDKFAQRGWGAFDSTSLVDAKTDTLIEAGENGILYTIKLKTIYNPSKSLLKINPKVTKYRYTSSISKQKGIENSVAIYKNFAYFADNDGLLQCIDLNTLSPIWARNVSDDTDSTIALEESNNNVSLYTACEVDKQGRSGYSYIRKIDAKTGKLLWQRSYKCSLNRTNGGVLGAPVIGKNDIDDLVIYSIARCNGSNGGKLIAFNKSTGKTVWEIPFNNYSWSSPVDVYTNNGHAYIVFCDSAGNMFLIDGQKGKILNKVSLGANVEGSPAVYENMIVVGTRGQKIWGVKIK